MTRADWNAITPKGSMNWGPHAVSVALQSGESFELKVVGSPHAIAWANGVDLNAALASDPEKGDAELARWKAVSQSLIETHSNLAYLLTAAHPGTSTPMQYGGFHLELDRELLALAQSKGLVMVIVDGETEPYLDALTDLPADILAWHMKASGTTPAQLRADTQAAFAGDHEDAEFQTSVPTAEFFRSAMLSQTPATCS